jgi:hypothetical protein
MMKDKVANNCPSLPERHQQAALICWSYEEFFFLNMEKSGS